MDKTPRTVDDYINNFNGEEKARLEHIRDIVKTQAPDAEEGIMYGLVGYKLNKKPLVYFGGFEHHVGFYATPNGHEAFKTELAHYKQGKGSVQFPLNEPLPTDLIARMVVFRRDTITHDMQKGPMTLTLIEKEHLADNIWAFRFKPSEPLKYTAGQFVRVELPHNNPDKEGTKRWFTDSAAPYQGIVQISTRVTDSTFKQALSKLEVGSQDLQLIDTPDGDFTWGTSEHRRVFVAGGIGVTPFYSMLKQRVYDQQPLDVTLVYSGRTADLPFKTEFDTWAAKDNHFKVVYAVGEPLTAQKLTELVPNIAASLVYLSGPEPMVEALGDALRAQGQPEALLKQDFFPNYTASTY